MSLVINTNIASIDTQRYLTKTQNSVQQAEQRLSSGLRINSAKDDAAGLAIAQRLTAQVNGSNTAVANANNGISLAQTAEGSLQEITNNLQRIRELAVQSANATNSATDRAALQTEASSLVSEIQRVATTSSFNGVNLLNGTFTSQTFQVGANAGETINVASLVDARTSTLGQTFSATVTSVAATQALTAGSLTINGQAVSPSISDGVSTQSATFSALAVANAINSSNITGVTATANATAATGGAAVLATGADLAAGDLSINGVNIVGTVDTTSAATAEASTIGLINAQSTLTGVTAADNGAGKITLTAADGRNIAVTATANGTKDSGFATATNATTVGTVKLTSIANTSAAANITVTAASAAAGGGFAASSNAATLNSGTVGNIDISTTAGATSAISTVDSALASINSGRATLGAIQNRFTSVVANLQTTSENESSALSTIQDADFAQETANYTKANVLQQAATSILSQANSNPQQVLKLLQNL